jgi:hypothetical protein
MIAVMHPKRTDVRYLCTPHQPTPKQVASGALYRCGCCGHSGLLSLAIGTECLACGCIVVEFPAQPPINVMS